MFGLRYPNDTRYNESDNYGAWIPYSGIELFIKDPGHQLIPRDYVIS